MSNEMFSINTELAESKKEVFENLESPLEWLPTAPSPRYIKSHLPLSLLPPHLLDTTKVMFLYQLLLIHICFLIGDDIC